MESYSASSAILLKCHINQDVNNHRKFVLFGHLNMKMNIKYDLWRHFSGRKPHPSLHTIWHKYYEETDCVKYEDWCIIHLTDCQREQVSKNYLQENFGSWKSVSKLMKKFLDKIEFLEYIGYLIDYTDSSRMGLKIFQI